MNNNQQEKCTDDTCITCSLIEEFRIMVKDDVPWENALRHILDVAFTKDDEHIAEILDECYSMAFHDGIMFGIEQSQKALDNVSDFMENKIAEDETKFNSVDEPEDLIPFENEEDDNDKIQRLIKGN